MTPNGLACSFERLSVGKSLWSSWFTCLDGAIDWGSFTSLFTVGLFTCGDSWLNVDNSSNVLEVSGASNRPTSLILLIASRRSDVNVPVNSKTAHASPPGKPPGHLTFLKNFGQIPRYVASLDGQIPHPLELQRGSNSPPSRHVKANWGNKFCKISNHYEFLVQLVFVPHFKRRHIPR